MRHIVRIAITSAAAMAWLAPAEAATNRAGAITKFDGVEVLAGGAILVSSQGDSSLHLFTGNAGRAIIKTGGAPADIAVDTKRNRVAVPFVDRGVVEIWELPANR